ncbi:MAG: ABC transporter substrate-binding protein, partial [Burkholderiales bacterium]
MEEVDMQASKTITIVGMASIRTGWQLLVLAAVICSGPTALAQMKPGITPEQRAAALKEGTVNYYTARATLTANTIARAASKALGIKVVVTRLGSSLAFNRAVQEFETGVHNADVIDTSVVGHFYTMKEKGMLIPYVPASIGLFRSKDYFDPEHFWHASQIGLGAIQYNTNLIKGDMIPRTWKDLAHPKYKGKLIQGHIKASG